MARILAPIDMKGNFCGVDEGLKRYKYLYFTVLSDNPDQILSSGVCVKHCPVNQFQSLECPYEFKNLCESLGSNQLLKTT